MSQSKLLETEIKVNVVNYLIKNDYISYGSLLLNEYSIDCHSRRVDLVTIIGDTSVAFEIKSEADNLNRIEGQIEKYLSFFDKLVIVAAPKHINKIIKVSPQQVAIWEISNKGISIIRAGKIKRVNNGLNLLKLMTVRELSELANQISHSTGYKNRNESECILKKAPVRLIRSSCFANIATKYSKSNYKFWIKVREQTYANVQDIGLLSLYQAQRNALKKKSANKLIMLEKLLKNSIDDLALFEASKKSNTPIFGQIPNDILSLISV
jgi:hypothetical protein